MTIGLFDSGAGGLAVLRHLQEQMPDQDFLYLADTAHFPYGDLEPDAILAYAEAAIALLIERGAQHVVVACNTASAYLNDCKRKVPVTRIIEPTARACKPYARVGVIGTTSTISSGAYQSALGKRCRLAIACPRLVEMAEENRWDADVAREELAPLSDIDALLLGCTHYSLLRDEIQSLIGEIPLIGVDAIDVAPTASGTGTVSYLATGDRLNHHIPPMSSTTAPSNVNVREGNLAPSTTCTSTS